MVAKIREDGLVQLTIPHECPECDASLDGVRHPTDDNVRPKPGDASICAYCGTLLLITEEGLVRAPEHLEAQIPPSMRAQALEIAKQYIGKKRRANWRGRLWW